MAVNKNFVVKNGLEVNNGLIVADALTNKVGIGSTIPSEKFDVDGTIYSRDSFVSGISTSNRIDVGIGGTLFTARSDLGYVGVSTSLPQYLLDVRSPVSTGQTALYVYGDLRVSGDINVDDINFDQADINRLYITENIDINNDGSLYVTGISTLSSLIVTGVSTLGSVKISSGIITASSGIVTYYGDGSGLSNISGLTVGGSITHVQYNNGTATLAGSPNLTFDGTTTRILSGIVTTISGTNLYYTGISTITNISGQNINLSGIITSSSINTGNINSSGIITSISLNTGNINSSGIITSSSINTGNINLSGSLNSVSVNTGIITSTSLNTGNISSSGIVTSISLNTGNINSSGIITCTDLNSTSDINLKENIKTISNALEKVEKIRGVSFDWKENGRSSIGVVAQEIESIFPEIVSDTEIKTVNYNGLIGVLIEAVKELSNEVKELKNTK